MRKTGILLMVLAGVVAAQQTEPPQQQPQTPAGQAPASMQQGVQEPLPPPPAQVKVRETNLVEKVQAPSESDVYCGGFISSQAVPETSYVRAGWGTPQQTRFVEPNYIYAQGSGFAEGSDYLIVRKLRDPNRWESYKGQHSAIVAAGQPYADIGQASVVKGGIRGSQAILAVKKTCEPIVPGDYVIPFENRPRPELKYTGAFDPFAPPTGKLTGRIISSRDFDQNVGTGKAVYLSVGSDQGVKVGDYFHATRTYEQIGQDSVDSLAFKATTTEDTQANTVTFPKNKLSELPRRSLGEMIVIGVHPKSATAMVTFALEDVKVLDLEEYLLSRQYMKYNLRFYWKSADRDNSRFEDYGQSYIRTLSNIVCYQLDRNTFEAELLRRNRAFPNFTLRAPVADVDVPSRSFTRPKSPSLIRPPTSKRFCGLMSRC